MNQKARDPHQDLIDSLSLLVRKTHITKAEAIEIANEAKRRFPEGNPAYGQSVLWQLCKDRGIAPADIPSFDLAGSAVKVLRGVRVGAVSAQKLLTRIRIPGTTLKEAKEDARAAEALLFEANDLAKSFLEAIGHHLY